MTAAILISLRPPARLAPRADDGGLVLDLGNQSLAFGSLGQGLTRVLRLLTADGATESSLEDTATELDGPNGLAEWYHLREGLRRRGVLRYEVRSGREPVARLTPLGPEPPIAVAPPEPDRRWILSRFALLRRRGTVLALETPRAAARVECLHPGAVAIVACLTSPSGAADIAARSPALPGEVTAGVLALLEAANLLTVVGPDGLTEEDTDPVLAGWNPTDLLFHSRSREGRFDESFGATAPGADRRPAPPAVKPGMDGPVVELFQPSLDEVASRDPPFQRVLEARRSIATYADAPIDAAQLGEFLYRTARVLQVEESRPDSPGYRVTQRPYPGAGSCYELEVYLAVAGCDGLVPGLYHYDPLGHRLEQLGHDECAEALFADTRMTGVGYGPRQVLVVLAARFGRVNWKYASIGYALILKDAGVLLQTMYLVATAMGLAPCAVGSGHADRLAAAIGTRFEEESAVAELLLGTRAEPVDHGASFTDIAAR